MLRKTYLVSLSVVVVISILGTFACLPASGTVEVNLQVNPPASDEFRFTKKAEGSSPLAVFDVPITSVNVIVRSGTQKVFEQSFSSINNVSFKLERAGTYRIEVYAYGSVGGQNRGIFYAVKEQALNYGTNFVTMEGQFFKGYLRFTVESTQSVLNNWTYENCVIVFTKSSNPSIVQTHNLTSEISASTGTYVKLFEIDPGVWKVNLTLKLRSRNDNTEYVYNLPENSYFTILPSATEVLGLSLRELESGIAVNVNVTNITRPYVEPVRNLTLDYSKATDRLTIRWEYPNRTIGTRFQIFRKLRDEKGMRLTGETTGTSFETTIGGEFDNIEYYAVNVIQDGRESGTLEASDVVVRIFQPLSGATVSGQVQVRTGAIDAANRVSRVVLSAGTRNNLGSVSARPYNINFDTRNLVDGNYVLRVEFYDRNDRALAYDSASVTVLNWQKLYGSGTGYDIIETNDNNGYIGVADRTDATYVFRISKNGNLLWERVFNGVYGWGANRITRASGGYILVGWKSVQNRETDGYVFKINENGNIVWEQTFGSTGTDRLYSITKTSDGNYVVAGYMSNRYDSSWYRDACAIKVGEDGSVIWQRTYGNVASSGSYSYYEFRALKENSSGGFFAVGVGRGNSWLAILDSAGVVRRERYYDYSYYDEYFYDLAEVSDGVILSSFYASWGTYYPIRKFLIDPSAISEGWSYETYGFSGVLKTADGQIVFPYGSSRSANIHKVRNTLAFTTMWQWSSPVGYRLYKVIEDSSGDLVAIGDGVLVVKIRGNGTSYY